MKTGIIHFRQIAHVILDGPFPSQEAIMTMPKTHARVPRTTCDHTVIEATRDISANPLTPPTRLGIMTIKIVAV